MNNLNWPAFAACCVLCIHCVDDMRDMFFFFLWTTNGSPQTRLFHPLLFTIFWYLDLCLFHPRHLVYSLLCIYGNGDSVFFFWIYTAKVGYLLFKHLHILSTNIIDHEHDSLFFFCIIFKLFWLLIMSIIIYDFSALRLLMSSGIKHI